MTNAKIVQPPSPPPPKLVVLEMSMEEAAWLLAKIAGSRRVAAHTIYRALAEAGVPQGALAGGIAFGSSAEEGWRRCQAVNQATDAKVADAKMAPGSIPERFWGAAPRHEGF